MGDEKVSMERLVFCGWCSPSFLVSLTCRYCIDTLFEHIGSVAARLEASGYMTLYPCVVGLPVQDV